MYRLGFFYSQLVHFSHFGRMRTGWGFCSLSWYILAILGENVPAGVFEFSAGTFLAILGENVPAGGFFFSGGSFRPFWVQMYRLGAFGSQLWPKLYRLGVFYSQPVHFGHLAKMCQLQFFCSQPVHFGHFGRKCNGWEFFIFSRYIFIMARATRTGLQGLAVITPLSRRQGNRQSGRKSIEIEMWSDSVGFQDRFTSYYQISSLINGWYYECIMVMSAWFAMSCLFSVPLSM